MSPEARVIFDQFQKRMGKVPNLYATMGYSANALKGFVDFDASFSHGAFSGKEQEAIALVVSEVNGCKYCLAGHTAAAIRRGFTQAETLDLRRGEIADSRLDVIIKLAKSISENKGRADQALVDSFFAAGFDEGALMELVGLVTVRVFTNYVYALTEIPIDFPEAEPLS